MFAGLSIWKTEKYRKLQGAYPVIFLSFANIKADNYNDAKNGIISVINGAYRNHEYLR